MPRTPIFAATLAVLAAGEVRAQVTDITSGRPDYRYNYLPMTPLYERPMTAEDLRRNEIEQAYNETVRTRIPDKKPSKDPWKNIRPAPASTAADRHRPE